MKTNYVLFIVFLTLSVSMTAQNGKQRKADKLYDNLAYFEAVDVYKELIENDYNTVRNKQKLADAYIKLRSPENAVYYYEDIIEGNDVSPEYYYKYAQALRGVKRYDESREWLEKYLESGGESEAARNMLEDDGEYQPATTYRLEKATFNSDKSDFGVFEKDGKIYFVSARGDKRDEIYSWNGEPYLDIYEMDDQTEEAKVLSGDVNTKLHDGPAVISPDGNTMYFTRNNFKNNREGKRDKDATNHLKIYRATKDGASWEDVEELSINSDEYSVGHPSLSPDGETLYFTSDMPGGQGGTDIYKVSVSENELGEPENLGSTINTEQDETFPFVDEDGVLYFSSNGHGGLGLADIFRVEDEENPTVKNLGKSVNSNLDDFAFFKIEGSDRGYISTNRDGGSDNIYTFNELPALMLKGKVVDAVNDKPIASATVRIFDEDQNELLFLETDEEGNFETEIDRDRKLPVEAKQIEYEEYSGVIDTEGKDDQTEMEYNINLQPVADVEYLAEIDNIYFDFDKSNIREDAAKELDKLVDLMKNEYPELVIEIGSHTDFRGSEKYNEGLAERRAESTKEYLISQGIDENRIHEARGYGESQPAIDCERCSKEEHQLNRRSMFKVVDMD